MKSLLYLHDGKEFKEKLGEKNAKQIYMSHYADMYARRSAFKSELKSYGWIKR